MIACVGPSVSCTDHTINTLRYADRVKEKPATQLLNAAAALRERNEEPKEVPARPPPPRAQKPPARPPSRKPVPPKKAEAKESAPKARDQAKRGAKEAPRQPKPRAPPPPAQPKERPTRQDDLALLHSTLERGQDVAALHKTVDSLFEAEEALLNAHMTVIQENAELLTEEGRMLQQVQGGDVVDYDIDTYVARLGAILNRKAEQIAALQHEIAANLTREHDHIAPAQVALLYVVVHRW